MENLLIGRKAIGSQGSESSNGMNSQGGQMAPDVTVVSAGDTDHSPKVETVSENGVITRIIVTCSCGKCTELQCKY